MVDGVVINVEVLDVIDKLHTKVKELNDVALELSRIGLQVSYEIGSTNYISNFNTEVVSATVTMEL